MTRALVGRRILSAAAAVAVTALGGASVAWACSAQAQAGINGGQTSGPVGTNVTVTGRDFGPGPVQVRWNSRGGALLGEGQGPSFSVPITIPQAPAGVHYIVALQTVGSSTASLAFEVTAPARTNTNTGADNTSGTTSTSASGADEEITTNSTQTNSATNTSSTESQPSTNTSTANTQTAESANTATAGPSSAPATQANTQGATNPTAATTSSPGATANASAATPTSARAASANPAVVTSPSGQAVFGGSSATPAAPVEADSPSAATVSGDTWSGFAGAKPSLLANAPATPADSGSTSGLGLGMGLLGAGVVALFAGFAAAESSRKRALAGAERY